MTISTGTMIRRYARPGSLATTAAGIAVSALAIAACSSSSKSPAAPASAPVKGSPATTTVAIRTISGTGDVLVDAKGRTLYVSDQEMTGNKVLCSSDACTAIWTPLTVPAGQTPTGPSSVSSMIATVKRPDGSAQVEFNGAPLYTFTFDHSAGAVGGNGQKDSFDGTNFTWHAATATGVAAAPSTSSDTGNGGYGNGY